MHVKNNIKYSQYNQVVIEVQLYYFFASFIILRKHLSYVQETKKLKLNDGYLLNECTVIIDKN